MIKAISMLIRVEKNKLLFKAPESKFQRGIGLSSNGNAESCGATNELSQKPNKNSGNKAIAMMLFLFSA